MLSKVTSLAVKRHDIDAGHFQSVYSKDDALLTKKERAFLHGRNLVLKELEEVLKDIPKGSKILDIGCGTAHLTHWIQQKGYEVYGLEPSNEMFNFARNNFPEIEIKKGISSELPYADHSFDFVVAFEVLRYLDKEENVKTYAEIYRVLKPEGRFFLTQVNLFATDFYYFFHQVKSVYSKLTKKIHHYCNFTTAAAEEKKVLKAGFKKAETLGVFAGSIRLAYKFGGGAGNAYAAFYDKTLKKNRFTGNGKNRSAHLIVMGTK